MNSLKTGDFGLSKTKFQYAYKKDLEDYRLWKRSMSRIKKIIRILKRI